MSKVLLLSAGSSDVSGNKKAAEYSKGYLKEKGVEDGDQSEQEE